MHWQLIKTLLTLIILTSLSACAPGLGSTLDVTSVVDMDVPQLRNNLAETETKVNILPFQDNRSVEAIAQIDGRLIKPNGDLGVAVQTGFERTFRKNGVKLSLFDSPTIRGSISEWRVFVTPGFPSSSLETVATIKVELLDKAGQIQHRAEYSGNYQRQHPFLNESAVQSALSEAMGFAIQEALSDEQLINKLTTLSTGREEIPSPLNYLN